MLRARRPSDPVEIARAHGARVHGFTPVWYSEQRLASMAAVAAGAMADVSDPEMWRTTPQGGAVAGDAHRRKRGGSVAAMKDSALSRRRGGRP
jgi:hypothetical protein